MSISTIKYSLLVLIILFLTACTQNTEKTKCNTKLSTNEFFKNTATIIKKSKHNEKSLTGYDSNSVPIKEIRVFNDYDKQIERNESIAFVNKYNLKKRDGFSLSYFDQNLTFVTHYLQGKKEGVYLTLKDNYPNLLLIYSNDKEIGMVAFWEEGNIRSIKFGTEHNKPAGKHSYVHENGTKAFEYLTQNGVNYWAVYSPNGQPLFKYPRNNDFCKIQFFKDGKEVKIPLYFDQQEFENVYKELK